MCCSLPAACCASLATAGPPLRATLQPTWRLAGTPTRRSPLSVKATTEGVVRWPSAFSMTRGALPSITATHELVVPRSMPMTSSARTADEALLHAGVGGRVQGGVRQRRVGAPPTQAAARLRACFAQRGARRKASRCKGATTPPREPGTHA